MHIRFIWFYIFILAALPVKAASSPSSREDERIEREKVLRAADQLDMLAPQVETLKTEIEQLKNSLQNLNQTIEKLQAENSAVKKSLADMETARAKEREALIDEVTKIIQENAARKKPSAVSSPPPPASGVTNKSAASLSSSETKPKAETGYEHVVSAGETLTAIARAYQAQGVKVTISDLIKANNLNANGAVKVGQKLFIPKK